MSEQIVSDQVKTHTVILHVYPVRDDGLYSVRVEGMYVARFYPDGLVKDPEQWIKQAFELVSGQIRCSCGDTEYHVFAKRWVGDTFTVECFGVYVSLYDEKGNRK